jgi:hypothetical protein
VTGAVAMRELGEGGQQRDPPEHAPLAIAVLSPPGRVLLDLRPDPQSPDPVHGLRLDEVVLQHLGVPFRHEVLILRPSRRRYVPAMTRLSRTFSASAAKASQPGT